MTACTQEPKVEQEPKGIEDIADAKTTKEAMDVLKDISKQGGDIKSVDVLKSCFPDRILGMKKQTVDGSKNKVMNMGFSEAHATYGDEGQSCRVSVVDISLGGLLKNTLANWTELEVDKEDSSMYERTTEYKGNPAYVKYNKDQKSGQLSMVVDEELVVVVEVENMEDEKMYDIFERLKLNKLYSK